MFVFPRARVRVAGDVLPFALVGPAREGHRAGAIKQLAMGRGERAAETPRPHLAEVGDAQSLEVGLHDVRAGGFGQAGEDCGISDSLEARQPPAADQPDRLSGAGAPDDGSVRRAGVGGGEFEGVGAEVFAAVEPNGEAASGRLAVLPEAASLVAGALKGGKGFGRVPELVSLPAGET